MSNLAKEKSNNNRNRYGLRPILIDVKIAHTKDIIVYDKDGRVSFRHKELTEQEEDIIRIDKDNQFPLIRPTFDDLSKALSSAANSPLLSGEKTLRWKFEKELNLYEELVEKAYNEGRFEPDYGTYVFDRYSKNLYLIAPEFWHRLGLITNTSKLLTDVKQALTWRQIRTIFDNVVIGFVGASVGGNIVEGVCREIRPKTIKVADPDWIEITNFNRFERGSLRYLSFSRGNRSDPKNPYETLRVNKAEIVSYEQYLLDPYATWHVYKEGIHADNVQRFLKGDGRKEPPIDILVEESDDLRLKIKLRELCRKEHIPVLMMSDFGHLVEGQFQDFKDKPKQPLGYKTTDREIHILLEKAMSSGKREDRFAFIRGLCGGEFERDEFGQWIRGEGEQPTSSLPQSGTVAMASGGIGAKIIALYLLGHKVPERFIYDLRRMKVIIG